MPASYTERVAHNLDGLQFVSPGLAPGCAECATSHDLSPAAFAAAWESGDVNDDGGFSWAGCGVCDNPLGGTRYVWHAADTDGALLHFGDACTDCVCFLANGTIPEGGEHE